MEDAETSSGERAGFCFVLFSFLFFSHEVGHGGAAAGPGCPGPGLLPLPVFDIGEAGSTR